jgi:hypothetical protein
MVANSGLAADEQRVMDALLLAWEEWAKINNRNEDEKRDFNQAIHAAQVVLCCRIARRAYPDYWR